MSGVRMLHFLKDWWKFIQIHQYYTEWNKCMEWQLSVIIYTETLKLFEKMWIENWFHVQEFMELPFC